MKKIKRLPSALNYWEGWAILDSSGKCLLVIDNNKNDSIKEKDPSKHFKKITEGDIVYICELIEAYPLTYLDDPVLKEWLPIWEKRWSLLSRNDPYSKNNLDKLHRTLKGDKRGKTTPDDLKKIIARDIELFKDIYKRKRKNKKSIEKVIGDITDEGKYKIVSDRMWQVYKAYTDIQKKCRAVLNDDKLFFAFLEICREKIDLPVCIIYQDKFIFLKGETQGNIIRASF